MKVACLRSWQQRQIGVKRKKNFIVKNHRKIKKITRFVLINDRSKYVKRRSSSNKNFVKKQAIYGGEYYQKKAFERRTDFRTGTINFSLFREIKVASYTYIRPIHGNSLKEINFF